jgi:molybdopterin converting factor small subunit
MAIRVEFYGIARERAGESELTLELKGTQLHLGEVLQQVALRMPKLGRELIAGGGLHPSLTANVDGNRFVRDPQTLIRDGQSVLILSADAGG